MSSESLYRRFAGRTYKSATVPRRVTCVGIQSSPVVRVLVKTRRNQRSPEHWTPRRWMEHVRNGVPA